MNKTFYEFLCEEQSAGRLQTYFKAGVMSGMKRKMEIFAFHLANPAKSQWQVAVFFNFSKKEIWRIYQLMNQVID